MLRRKLISLPFAIAGLSVLPVQADTWPAKPIRLIVPFPPGGPVDLIARLMVPHLTKELGQPIVIDNRGGAGGVIGVTAAIQADPDGYTFGFGVPGAIAVFPHVGKTAYKAQDINYVTVLTTSPHVIAVNAASEFKDLKGLLDVARNKPGHINFGSPGNGTGPHLDGVLLEQEAGVDLVHVPYRGGAPAVNALMANEIQLLPAEISAVMPQLSKLRVLAVLAPQRSPQLPNVPTTAELGLPAVVAQSVYGIIAPAKTPTAISEKFAKAAGAAITAPDVKAKLASQGQSAMPSTPNEYRKLMLGESEKWGTLIKKRNITLD